MQSVVQPESRPPTRRYLTLGGSFNPIHVGHLICARSAAEKAGFTGVRLMVAGANPHKASADLAAAADRLAMCQLAVAGDPFYVVDSREVRRSGPSFTFDTAAELASETRQKVAWLVGTDLLSRLHTWHRFNELIDVVDFIVMRRAGHTLDLDDLDSKARTLAVRGFRVPSVEISSTEVRQRVRQGISVEHWVPPGVARFIADRGIYLKT